MTFSEQITEGATGFDDWADGTRFEIPFFLFQDCSHFAAFRRPERFLDLLLTQVRPAVTAAPAGPPSR
ncbi:hypothetical protein ABT143_25700 [Streptomyces sp. NPDC002033]|uniref:hypothetical protein n=1 Tax=unclassified Streptomyces TaxID=2593676 RepID=UPI003325592A